jgi:hypothetical protein
MFEADLSRTRRAATLDADESSPATFARASIRTARSCDCDQLVWHFASKDVVRRLVGDPSLGRIAGQLFRRGSVSRAGLTITLATRRLRAAGRFDAPLACWWASDDQLLKLDSTHRPRIDALVSSGTRAPIWLTAFGIDLGAEPIGVIRDSVSLAAGSPTVDRIEVGETVREQIASLSRSMTLSTNGVHDSLAGPLVAYARSAIRSGQATAEGVAVAALQVGWWPDKIPALVERIS